MFTSLRLVLVAAILGAAALAFALLRPDPLERAAADFGLPEGAIAAGPPGHTAADGATLRSLALPFSTPPGAYASLAELLAALRARCQALGAAAEPGPADDWPALICRLPDGTLLGGRGTCGAQGCRASLLFSQP